MYDAEVGGEVEKTNLCDAYGEVKNAVESNNGCLPPYRHAYVAITGPV